MKVYNKKYEVKLRDSVSKPEELLKLLVAQPPPPKHAHSNSVKVESSLNVAGNTVHSSEKVANYNSVGRTTIGEQKKSQGFFYKGGEKFFSGPKRKHRGLNTIEVRRTVDEVIELELKKMGNLLPLLH